MSNRYYLEDEFIVDGKAKCAYDDIIHNPLELLNEQDQRIAELEKEKQKDKLLLNMYECDTLEELTNDFSEMQSRFLETLRENEELKKQLKKLLKVLRRIK